MSITPTHIPTTIQSLILCNIPSLRIDDFNRTICWDIDRERLLIDSIFKGFYIPEIQIDIDEFLIDGQHRLNAIYRYFQNKFDVNITVDNESVRLYYKDLPPKLLNQFNHYIISVARFPQLSTELRKECFKRVNSGSSFKSYETLWLEREQPLMDIIINKLIGNVDSEFLQFMGIHLQDFQNHMVMFTNLESRSTNVRKALLDTTPYCICALLGKVNEDCRKNVYDKLSLLKSKWNESQVIRAISLLNETACFVGKFKCVWRYIRSFHNYGCLIMYAILNNQTQVMSSYLNILFNENTDIELQHKHFHMKRVVVDARQKVKEAIVIDRFQMIKNIVEEHENREHL